MTRQHPEKMQIISHYFSTFAAYSHFHRFCALLLLFQKLLLYHSEFSSFFRANNNKHAWVWNTSAFLWHFMNKIKMIFHFLKQKEREAEIKKKKNEHCSGNVPKYLWLVKFSSKLFHSCAVPTPRRMEKQQSLQTQLTWFFTFWFEVQNKRDKIIAQSGRINDQNFQFAHPKFSA